MNSTGDSIATPLVRGMIAAALSLGTAIALVVVPALAAQVAGTRSSATALDAIIIALNVLVLGHGGGIVLSTGVIDGAVTLTPFGLLGLLLLISILGMRRVGRALQLVRDDGVLRLRALRDAGSALGAYAGVYAIGMAVLAGIGRSTDSSPVVTSAIVSGAMVAVLGGVLGILWSLRREATSTIPGVRVLELLPAPFGDVARSVLLALVGLLGVGMLLSVVMMVVSVPEQSSLFDALDPGIVGGIVLTLVQLALLPLLAVWALVVLLGGTVGVGTSSSISLDGSATGVMPALPLLGAFPGPGDFSAWLWLLLVVPAVPVVVGALRLVRDVEDLERRDRITAWIAYPVAVVVGVLLLAGLSTGGIGEGRLVHLGPQMSSLILPLLGVVVVSTGVVLVALASPVVPWVRAQTAALRARVESAESAEGSEDAEFSGRSGRGEASGARADEGADGTADEVSSDDDRADDDRADDDRADDDRADDDRADDDRADGDRAGDDGDGDGDEDAHADDDRAAGDDHAAEGDHGGLDPDSRTAGIDGGVSRPSGR
ncbi:cell division protein PerM [Brachybacterium tyrofermentans]|uniref:cell division protein PerM n=1 Tax=Brachybacterium tyrofermentans TaxID=47848 RepID=UPI003FD378A9